MQPVCKTSSREAVMRVLPEGIRRELALVCATRRGGLGTLHEVRLKAGGVSSAHFSGDEVLLSYRASRAELDATVRAVTESSLYAYRDTISRGYIPMGCGVRVGVCGYARYSGAAATVSEISSLIFRIPTGQCDFADELYSAFIASPQGMLIYSPPGGGKTTALRSLAGMLGKEGGRRVVVVDERCEFDTDDYISSRVDILRGYNRKEGIEIAVRTLSPEIIMVDELMGEECDEIAYSALSGIPVVATAHAGSFTELLEKRQLRQLIERGVFHSFVGIVKHAGIYGIDVSKYEREVASYT